MRLENIAYDSDGYRQACALREAVLRVPLGMKLREEDVAGEQTQMHCVVWDDDHRVIGTVTLKPLTETHIKLRQMAIAPEVQNQGFGATLVHFAEALARYHFFTSIECNARCYAQGFYERLGYRAEGEPFEEVGIATVKMTKLL